MPTPTTGTRGAGTTIVAGTLTIGQLLDITLPDIKVEQLDLTSGEDASDATALWKRKLAGWSEAGELSVDVVYKKTNSTLIMGARGVTKTWVITAPDGSHWDFSGFISGIGASAPLKDLIKQKLAIAVDGAITFTAGA